MSNSGTEEGISRLKIYKLYKKWKVKSSGLVGGFNKFENYYEPRINLVNDERGELLADSHKF